MGSLIIQFHAVPDDMAEMIELLRNVVPKASFYLRLKSREFVNYVPELANLFAINRVDWIVASLVPIDEVPEIRTHFVQEVAASAKARDERGDTALKAWARFIRKFRKQLHSGAYITTSLTDEGQYYKNAHATSRAVQAAKDGLILCQASSVRYNYDRKPPLVDVMTTNSTT
jgi:hypothetical protein